MPKHTAIYVRVSGDGQTHASQLPDLERYAAAIDGPVVWYTDKHTAKASKKQKGPGWQKLDAAMRAGQVCRIVCWKLDRLDRSARELVALLDDLRQRKIDLVCVAGGISGLDTPEGYLMAGIIAQFAEYDNEVRRERIIAGQAAAKAKGVTWGGSKAGVPKKVTPEKATAIRDLHQRGTPISRIAKAVGLSRPTIYSVLGLEAVTR